MQKQPPQQQQRLVATNTKQVLSSSFTHNAKEVRNSGGALLAANQIAIPGQRSAQNTSEAVVVRAPVSQFTVNGGRTEMVVRETIEPTTVIVEEKQVGGFVVQPPQMVVQPPPIIIQPPNVMVQQTGFASHPKPSTATIMGRAIVGETRVNTQPFGAQHPATALQLSARDTAAGIQQQVARVQSTGSSAIQGYTVLQG